jgi:hypothetical protein
MRKDKKGVFMAIYLVMLTLLMCGLVLGFYLSHQKKLAGSLVSPLEVLEAQDDLEIFEMREKELIVNSASSIVWNAGGTKEEFRNRFLSGIGGEMESFVFEDLVWEGQKMDGNFNRTTFLSNVLYSVKEESGDLVLRRSKIGKRMTLVAEDTSKVNFPVEFGFDFEREYLISKKDGKIKVEVIY